MGGMTYSFSPVNHIDTSKIVSICEPMYVEERFLLSVTKHEQQFENMRLSGFIYFGGSLPCWCSYVREGLAVEWEIQGYQIGEKKKLGTHPPKPQTKKAKFFFFCPQKNSRIDIWIWICESPHPHVTSVALCFGLFAHITFAFTQWWPTG